MLPQIPTEEMKTALELEAVYLIGSSVSVSRHEAKGHAVEDPMSRRTRVSSFPEQLHMQSPGTSTVSPHLGYIRMTHKPPKCQPSRVRRGYVCTSAGSRHVL
jgi:hypothetical protein